MIHLYLRNKRGGADKSLARPGKKRDTAINLGIYSAYSQRRSIRYLAHCSNFWKPLKKKIRMLSVRPDLRGSRDLRDRPKIMTFNCFSVQWTGGSPTGPDPENGVGDLVRGSTGRPFSSGLQVPGEAGHCHARTKHLVNFQRRFSFKMSLNCTSRDE